MRNDTKCKKNAHILRFLFLDGNFNLGGFVIISLWKQGTCGSVACGIGSMGTGIELCIQKERLGILEVKLQNIVGILFCHLTLGSNKVLLYINSLLNCVEPGVTISMDFFVCFYLFTTKILTDTSFIFISSCFNFHAFYLLNN